MKAITQLETCVLRDGAAINSREPLYGPEDVARFLASLLEDHDREHFYVLVLNQAKKITGVHLAHVGSLTSSIVDPKQVAKVAILGNAASVMLAHNHPSGNTEPSREDVAVTKTIVEALKLLQIKVLDHVIVGLDGRYTSMQERMPHAFHQSNSYL